MKSHKTVLSIILGEVYYQLSVSYYLELKKHLPILIMKSTKLFPLTMLKVPCFIS
jgi:hypothetical protein